MVTELNNFRDKYPGEYNDLSDVQLAEKIVAKWPGEYDDVLEKAQAEAGQSLNRPGEEPEPMTYGEQLVDVGKHAVAPLKNVGRVYPVLETALNAVTSSYGVPISGFAGLGALMFSDLDTAKEVVQKVQEAMVYQPQADKSKEFMQDAFYPLEIYERDIARPLGKVAEDLGYPNVGAGIHSIFQWGPSALGLKGIKGTTTGVSVPKIKAGISKAVKTGVEKAKIIPTKMANSKRLQEQYYKDAESGVTNIIRNRDNLKIADADGNIIDRAPKTLDEFTQAIDQTQGQLVKEYSALAGDTKLKVKVDSVVKELESMLNNKVLQDRSPETLIYVEQQMNMLRDRKSYTALEAQEQLSFLNQEVKSYKADGTMAMQGKALVATAVKNGLRKELNATIEKATGKDYGGLKEQWGALKTIRTDVRKATLKDAKASDKPYIDITDIYTAGHVADGLVSMSPGKVAGGGLGFAIKEWYKYQRSPNSKVQAMFKGVDKYMRKEVMPSVKPKDAAKVLASEKMAQYNQDYDNELMTDEQIEAFEELVQRGLIERPIAKHESSPERTFTPGHDYLRDMVSGEFGIKRRGVNKATGKKVIQYEDGRIEDDNG